MGKERINLFNRVFKCKWEANNACNICNLNVLDDMLHFLYQWPHFNSLRNSFIIRYLKLPCNRNECYKNQLIFNSKEMIDNLYNYVISTINITSLLTEY